MYSLEYHAAIRDDLSVIGTAQRRRIKVAIEVKLMDDPVRFGKPLQHSLQGLRSLRVGDYRVVFQIIDTAVYIVLIAHRSVVYKKVDKRHIS